MSEVLKYSKAEKISLKKHFSEKWLQDRIEEDPSILGLGEIDIFHRERRQSSGGRIDFLLVDNEAETMYETEIMLGATIVPHVIDLEEVSQVNALEEMSKLLEAVYSMEQFLVKNTCESELRGRFIIQLTHFKKKSKTYQVLSVDGKPYLDTYAGKVETVYMKEYFKYIRSQVRRVYPDEVERTFAQKGEEDK